MCARHAYHVNPGARVDSFRE
jgi:hypothetical protein